MCAGEAHHSQVPERVCSGVRVCDEGRLSVRYSSFFTLSLTECMTFLLKVFYLHFPALLSPISSSLLLLFLSYLHCTFVFSFFYSSSLISILMPHKRMTSRSLMVFRLTMQTLGLNFGYLNEKKVLRVMSKSDCVRSSFADSVWFKAHFKWRCHKWDLWVNVEYALQLIQRLIVLFYNFQNRWIASVTMVKVYFKDLSGSHEYLRTCSRVSHK